LGKKSIAGIIHLDSESPTPHSFGILQPVYFLQLAAAGSFSGEDHLSFAKALHTARNTILFYVFIESV
jgi:hypothetical protein